MAAEKPVPVTAAGSAIAERRADALGAGPVARAKPFAEACERNRAPILEVLAGCFADRTRVLEIGSGTGQHAVHFARALPHLVWQAAEMPHNLAGVCMWLDEAGLANTPPPVALDVDGAWPEQRFDAAFTANTLHIMSWAQVERTFARLPGVMEEDFVLAVYGPFNYGGRFTSASNAAFDASLKARSPLMGIRDFQAVDALARACAMTLAEDRALPANNRCLVWRRTGAAA